MSEDEADSDLLELLRHSLSFPDSAGTSPPSTGVLESAEYVVSNSYSVAISPSGTRSAAQAIHSLMRERQYSTAAWSAHDLHPKPDGQEATLNFIFTMDVLNFSFWSEKSEEERYAVEFRGKRWTGYWSLVACLHRAVEENIPILDMHFWIKEDCTEQLLQHIFRSATSEPMPMLAERLACLREAGRVLCEKHDGRVGNLVASANGSAVALVNLLVREFSCLRDEHLFEDRTVHFHKRAQIFVADIWGCFDGRSYGAFDDIDAMTMFADYRIPQMLHSLGVLLYSPQLEGRVRRKEELKSGERCEVEIRGCSVWAVEMIRREMVKEHPEEQGKVNSVLIDTFIYDTLKEKEARGELERMVPHHRVRSIWY